MKESGKFIIKELEEESKGAMKGKKGLLGKKRGRKDMDDSDEEAEKMKRQKKQLSQKRAGTIQKSKEEGVHII